MRKKPDRLISCDLFDTETRKNGKSRDKGRRYTQNTYEDLGHPTWATPEVVKWQSHSVITPAGRTPRLMTRDSGV